MRDKHTYLDRIVRDAVRRSLIESVQSNHNANEYEVVSVGDKIVRKDGRQVYHPVIIRHKNSMNESIYYHGTNSTNAKGIVRNGGLNSDLAIDRIGGDMSGDFMAAKGKNYLTSDPGNALRYALMSKGDDDVHIFMFDTTHDGSESGFDEDEIGHYLYLYLNGRIKKLGFSKRYLRYLTQDELHGIKEGDFRSYAATKKILDHITEEEKLRLYNTRDNKGNFIFKNLTVSGNIEPIKHYKVRRPTREEWQEMTDFKRYGDSIMDKLRDFFFKNRKEVK